MTHSKKRPERESENESFMIAFTASAVEVFGMSSNPIKEYAKLAEESGVLMNLEPLNVTTDHVGNFLQTLPSFSCIWYTS